MAEPFDLAREFGLAQMQRELAAIRRERRRPWRPLMTYEARMVKVNLDKPMYWLQAYLPGRSRSTVRYLRRRAMGERYG